MVLRPLPSPYRIGTDICFIPRIRRLLLAASHRHESKAKKKVPFLGISSFDGETNKRLTTMSEHLNPHFLAKLLRPAEIAVFLDFYQDVAGTMAHDRLYEHVAGRWAAKEAIIKAASRSYRNYDGSYKKPTFHDIFIWSSSKRLEAAILSEGMRDTHPQSNRGSIVANPKVDGTDFKEDAKVHHDATSELDGDMVDISISHDNDYAIATALFCDPSPS